MSGSTTKSKAVMEAVGTGVLVLTIQVAVGGGGGGSKLAPLAIGLILMVMVYAGGPISGAHYNPAVSLAVVLRQKMDVPDMIIYWISQFVGGYLGAIVGGTIINGGSYVVVSRGAQATATQAFVAEIVFTFILCFVVLNVATRSSASSTTKDNGYYGAAIGLTVTAGAITVGNISGGAFNPAVAVCLSVASGGGKSLMYAVGTAIANFMGGILAAVIFRIVAPEEFAESSHVGVNGGTTTGETTSLV